MKNNIIKNSWLSVILLALCMSFVACNKDDDENNNQNNEENGWAMMCSLPSNYYIYGYVIIDFGDYIHLLTNEWDYKQETSTLYVYDNNTFNLVQKFSSSYSIRDADVTKTNSNVAFVADNSIYIRGKQDKAFKKLSQPASSTVSTHVLASCNNNLYATNTASDRWRLYKSAEEGNNWSLFHDLGSPYGFDDLASDGQNLYRVEKEHAVNNSSIYVYKNGELPFSTIPDSENHGYIYSGEGCIFSIKRGGEELATYNPTTNSWTDFHQIATAEKKVWIKNIVMKNGIVYADCELDYEDCVLKSTDKGMTFELLTEGKYLGIGDNYIYVSKENGFDGYRLYKHSL